MDAFDAPQGYQVGELIAALSIGGLLFGEVRWRPEIGDPTVDGWLIVVAYVLAAALCFRRSRTDPARWVWLGLATLLLLLAINKQLDLQTLLTDLGRELARYQGWYARRREVQRVFVLVIGAATVLATLFGAWFALRSSAGSLRLALIGVGLLGVFIVIRAASFHHLDPFLGRGLPGRWMTWVLEPSGIALVCVAALYRS